MKKDKKPRASDWQIRYEQEARLRLQAEEQVARIRRVLLDDLGFGEVIEKAIANHEYVYHDTHD